MAGGVVDLLGDAVALLDDGRLFHLFVSAHQFVAALLDLAQVFLDLPVLAPHDHGEIEDDEMQHEHHERDEILGRRLKGIRQRAQNGGDHDVNDRIQPEADPEHDHVVAQSGRGEIEFGEHDRVRKVGVFLRKDGERHQEQNVHHIPADLGGKAL